MRPKDYDERAINLRMHHVSIRNMSEADFFEIGNRLYAISRAVGITKPFSATEDLPALKLFILQQFGEMAMDEIGYAFELGAAGKLQKPLELFNSFNIIKLGEVLNNYRTYFKQEKKKHLAYLKDLEIEQEKERGQLLPKSDGKDSYDRIAAYVRKNDMFPMVEDWQGAYLYLEAKGIIVLTLEEKQQLFDLHLRAIKQELHLERKKMRGDGREKNESEEGQRAQAKARCRKNMVQNYFNKEYKKTIEQWNEKQKV